MQTINLWSAMVRLADEHKKDSERNCGIQEDAAKVIDACSKYRCFGTELDLTVAENGEWRVRIFDHQDMDGSAIEIAVLPDGLVRVHRQLQRGDITDNRTITF